MFTPSSNREIDKAPFGLVMRPFLNEPGLPFAQVLGEETIAEAFAAEGVAFGETPQSVYTPAVTLWAFLSQVVCPDKSCRAAVARVIVLLAALGRKPCAADTGAYCRARAKIPQAVLRRLAEQVGRELDAAAPEQWRWLGRRVVVADGSTISMPDTAANQAEYPQMRAQKPGLGFPIVRLVLLFSWMTGAVLGGAMGPYSGKETGETALLRTVLPLLAPGDVLLADRYFGGYFLLAMLCVAGVDVVVRLHQLRKLAGGHRLRFGPSDERIAWTKPARPSWMSPVDYQRMPDTLALRLVQVQVHLPGFRPRHIAVVTSLLDAEAYPAEEILALYRDRWLAELDLRALKQYLAMDVLRCRTPEMVRKELWAHLLAYNLIRKVIAQAALAAGKTPRQLSFTGARQALAAAWAGLSSGSADLPCKLVGHLVSFVAAQPIGERPNRIEPRAVKRRPKPHKLLAVPRAQARAALLRPRSMRPAA